MTTLREAAQQALETLEALSAAENIIWVQKRAEIEVEHLRAVLAQQEAPKGGGNLPPPLQAEPAQEPVAWASKRELARIKDFDSTIYANGDFDGAVPLYAQPPRREWQGLTEEDMEDLLPLYSDPSANTEMLEFAAAIEAKLKEKNA